MNEMKNGPAASPEIAAKKNGTSRCQSCGGRSGTLVVPPIAELQAANGGRLEGALAALDGEAKPYCWPCQQGLRGHGISLYPLEGTRQRINKLIAEREARRAKRARAVAAEAERIRAGRALSRPVLAPVAMKVTGKDGRPLVGAAAAAVVGRALRAQPGFGSGKTRAERKAARRAAEKAGRDAALARGAALTAVALGDPLPGANGNGDGAN